MYANRNFIPFYMSSAVTNSVQIHNDYGAYNQFYIIDGQGICTTRSPDYQGSFEITENHVFDNGINGISIHKTTHANVKVLVQNNDIFDNGKSSSAWEHR